MRINDDLEIKTFDTMQELHDTNEDTVIREVAEEEKMSYDEVKEIWETFKTELKNAKKRRATKASVNKVKKKAKKKQAKASRKRNR